MSALQFDSELIALLQAQFREALKEAERIEAAVKADAQTDFRIRYVPEELSD